MQVFLNKKTKIYLNINKKYIFCFHLHYSPVAQLGFIFRESFIEYYRFIKKAMNYINLLFILFEYTF